MYLNMFGRISSSSSRNYDFKSASVDGIDQFGLEAAKEYTTVSM